MSSDLQMVASAVLRRAQQQGYVVPREIRQELQLAEQSAGRWKEIVELLRESLHYRQGRYYLLSAPRSRLQQQQNMQQAIQDALAELLAQQPDSVPAAHERRQEVRVPFPQPLQMRADDQEVTVLGRDLSPSGIRFVSGRSWLGRKVQLTLPRPQGEPVVLLVRILWTTATADGLFENGGTFLELASPSQAKRENCVDPS